MVGMLGSLAVSIKEQEFLLHYTADQQKPVPIIAIQRCGSNWQKTASGSMVQEMVLGRPFIVTTLKCWVSFIGDFW